MAEVITVKGVIFKTVQLALDKRISHFCYPTVYGTLRTVFNKLCFFFEGYFSHIDHIQIGSCLRELMMLVQR